MNSSDRLGEPGYMIDRPAAAVSGSQPGDMQHYSSTHRAGAGASRNYAAPLSAGAATKRPPVTPVLRSANVVERDPSLSGLLQRYRDAEAAWLKEKGKLVSAADAERKRRLKAETELRRVQQQLAFRLGEVQHLKAALKGRDCDLQDLQDRLREYELSEGSERTTQETVRQAQAERDELRAAMADVLQRLDAAKDVIEQADSTISGLERQMAAASAERHKAQEEASAAQAEADDLREAVEDLQWKCGLLQRLSDLTMDQNEEKTETLHTLLESESMLDAAAIGNGGGGWAGSECSLSDKDENY